MIVATPPSRGIRSRKRRRETEELSSASVDAVSEKNLKEKAPMILENSSLQGHLRTKEANRGDKRDGSLDKLNN